MSDNTIRKHAERYVRSGHFPTYLNNVPRDVSEAFWRIVRELDKERYA